VAGSILNGCRPLTARFTRSNLFGAFPSSWDVENGNDFIHLNAVGCLEKLHLLTRFFFLKKKKQVNVDF
jgi:hypothetical protein